MISVVFVSNFFNHHERFFCDELSKNPNISFSFIQTQKMDEERENMGWKIDIRSHQYVICSYINDSAKKRALDLCDNADVLILGSAPYEFVSKRVRQNKLTFYYAERLFRKGIWHMLNPKTFFTVLKRFIIPGRKSNFYLLAASAYTAYDTSRILAFDNRRFKWGHFIEVNPNGSHDRIASNQDKLKLLWAGRLIPLKHPEYPIYIANKLKSRGINFSLDIIGSGELENRLKELVNKYNLQNNVILHGAMPPSDVRGFMEKADIYMFTSDFNEGWGAVLGEAMASGCAVVTSHGIGATPFLIKHGVNGLIYETNNYKSFENNVIKLVQDARLRSKLSENACNTMIEKWNPKEAADRFYHLAKSLLGTGDLIYYEDGPISKALVLNNKWFSDDTI